MRLPSFVALGIAIIAATSLADDGAIQASLDPETIRQVDAVFTKYDRDNEPGCSVGIVRDGALIYRKGFGLANMEHKSPMSSNTLVEIGSMSKSFTAVCVAMLLDSGKVLADDDIRQYIPELHPFDPPIRIRHLIECKSGLWEHYHIMPLAGWVNLPVPSPFSREDALGIICGQRRLPFEPGTQFKYGSFD